jgi:16S rRNA processing protein RimM
LLTDRPDDRFVVGRQVYLEGTRQTLTIEEAGPVADGPGWWLRFREIPTRESADELRGQYLEIDTPVEEREPGRWFFHELEGLNVRSSTGEELGRVVEIYRAGGAEVFVVRGPRGELDVPGVHGIVTELAPERGEMIVDLDALALDARPVEDEDYVRPRDRRPKKQPKVKGPKPGAATPGQAGPGRTAGRGQRKGRPADGPAAVQPAGKASTQASRPPDGREAAGGSGWTTGATATTATPALTPDEAVSALKTDAAPDAAKTDA